MGFAHGHWTRNAWCVPVMVQGVTTSYILPGWLSMLKMGFLHRDINVGNVLMLDPPVTKPSGAWTMEQLVTQLRFQDGGEPVAKHVSLLEQTIRGLDSPGKCHGFVVDGDMAARLEDSLTLGDLRERSVSMLDCIGESG